MSLYGLLAIIEKETEKARIKAGENPFDKSLRDEMFRLEDLLKHTRKEYETSETT